MSIYYRFLHERSESYRSIELNVSSIRTSDLKLLVAEHSGLSKEYMKLFDLKVLDTDEKEIFSDDKLLPIYSRVVIQRIPWRELKEIHHDAQKSINNEEVVETVAETKLTLPSEYICKLCNYPLINPVLIKCIGSCGASACRDCVKNYLEENKSVTIKSCPSCKQRFRGSVPNKSLANMLAAINWDKFNYPVRNPKMESNNAGNNIIVEEELKPKDLGLSGNNLDNNIGKKELFKNRNIELNNSSIPESNLRNFSNVQNEEFDSLGSNSNSTQNINNSVSIKSAYSSGIVSNTSDELSAKKSSATHPVVMVNNNEIAQGSALINEGGGELKSKLGAAETINTLNSSNPGTKEIKIKNKSSISVLKKQQVSQNNNSHHHPSATCNSSPIPLPGATNNVVVPSIANVNTINTAHPNISTTTSSPLMSSSVAGSHPPHPPPTGPNIPILHPQNIPPHPGIHHQYMDSWTMQGPHPYITQFPPDVPGHPVPFHQNGFPTAPFPAHPITHQQNGPVPTVATIPTLPVVAGLTTVPGAPPHQFGYAMPPPPPGTHPAHFHQPYTETITPICGPYLTEKQRIKLAMSFPMLSEDIFNLIKAAQQSVKDIWSLLPKPVRSSLLQETHELNVPKNNDKKGKSFKKRKDYSGNSNNQNISSNNSGELNIKKRAV
ncbi:hypothetical protein FG386_003274 [Cryptosporidium ryanae]|uniref:uncharacterized protein n=1 Tax=Cryptosporidium ryanae TaxID=515981 RepID=UPI00351A0772|nr:hypothetical protein FG386_003274 [Cryptosporidium ryanae]